MNDSNSQTLSSREVEIQFPCFAELIAIATSQSILKAACNERALMISSGLLGDYKTFAIVPVIEGDKVVALDAYYFEHEADFKTYRANGSL